ncbi:alpha-hydroxy-acid oxidizing protein [Thermomonospora umbrina]|uniref:4-hydroxymandelate oxidase n=1 Tax=Thermomonospora umbrina TaxID=111806 RepID=A0A3D9T5G3_9ACTN|nr:alpha-hydroxy-acid oxidizing protein [Thermomonospora umbrina]REF00486.1 4-hydroxymandelate oxidase [Thermomonospora umbrina]
MHRFACVRDYEEAARGRLRPDVWDFMAGGAGEEITLRDNTAAFGRVRVWPRVLTGVGHVDTTVELLGQVWSAPIGIAPMALHEMCHSDAEIATVRAATAVGLPTVLSAFSSVAVEDVTAASPHANVWQQVYIFKDRQVTASMAERAVVSGVRALVVTVDSPWMGRRHRDIRDGFRFPDGLRSANLSASLSQWADISDPVLHSRSAMDPSLTWTDVEWLAGLTGLPLVVKGILAPDDAERALEAGADAIIVSNHGARQLDRTTAALDALPDVAAVARAGGVPVLLDGGVRSGTDVLIAMALGAAAVLVGRPVLYGLAVAGEAGVHGVLTLLVDELRDAMGLTGCSVTPQVGPELIAPAGLFHPAARPGGAPGSSAVAAEQVAAVRFAKHAQVRGSERTALGLRLKQRYVEGASIRRLAEDLGRSYGFTRNLLAEAGTAFRGPGIRGKVATDDSGSVPLRDSA